MFENTIEVNAAFMLLNISLTAINIKEEKMGWATLTSFGASWCLFDLVKLLLARNGC